MAEVRAAGTSDLVSALAVWERLATQCRDELIASAAIVDRTGQPRLGGFGGPVCRLVQSTLTGRERCRQCHVDHAFASSADGETAAFGCHLGLGLSHRALVVPNGDRTPDALLVVGLLTRRPEEDEVLAAAQQLGLDDFELRRALAGIPVVKPTDATSQQLSRLLEYVRSALAPPSRVVEADRPLGANTGPVRTREGRRVAITGIGIVSPIGIGRQAFAESLFAGRCGITELPELIEWRLPCHIGARVRDFDPLDFLSKRQVDRSGRSSQFALAASRMAVEDSGLDLEGEDASRVGVAIGAAIGGLEYGERAHRQRLLEHKTRVPPFLSIILFAGAVSSEVSNHFNVKGPSLTVSTGCAAGNDALGHAFHLIRSGRADLMLAGGSEAPFSEMIVGSFCAIRALSTRNDDPGRACRPFDKDRDGFIMSEGSAVFVLEELNHARRRGAHVYGELLGYAASGDAYDMVRPAPDGESAASAILAALHDASLTVRDIQYINAHGSSTPLNDATETGILKKVFGRRAYEIPVSSTKSMTGHPIGASGAFELAATLLGMNASLLPPTINLAEPDPACDLDYVPNVARRATFNAALSNSFGFGGKNACLIIGAP